MRLIIQSSGNQHMVQEGEVLLLEHQPRKPGEEFYIEEVLALVDGERVRVGRPTLEGVRVKCEALGEAKGKKVRAQRFKPYTGLRKVRGHRQKYTRVRVVAVEGAGG